MSVITGIHREVIMPTLPQRIKQYTEDNEITVKYNEHDKSRQYSHEELGTQSFDTYPEMLQDLKNLM